MPKRIKKWTRCDVCGSMMVTTGVCISCQREEYQEDAIALADEWVDGFRDSMLSRAIDRDVLVGDIQRAFEEAEQRLIDRARDCGYMVKEKR